MNIGLVVSTLGRTEPLERLLRSLTDKLTGDDHVVIVAQQRLAEVTALANRFRDAPWPITVTTSAPGAARGRNVGVAALPPGARLLHFPNETTWVSPSTLSDPRAGKGWVWALSEGVIGCGTSPTTGRGFRPAPSRPCERQWGTERVVSVP